MLVLGSCTANWPGPQRYELAQHEYLALSLPVQTDEYSDHEVVGDPYLTLWLLDVHTEHQSEEAN